LTINFSNLNAKQIPIMTHWIEIRGKGNENNKTQIAMQTQADGSD